MKLKTQCAHSVYSCQTRLFSDSCTHG